MLSALERGDAHARPVLFVLEEFDVFATQRQAFLYNLLDRVHSAAARYAVVGVTCRMDAADLLEKRVKSRFAHRQVFVMPPDSVQVPLRVLQQALLLPKGGVTSGLAADFNAGVLSVCADPRFARALQQQFDYTRDMRAFLALATHAVTRLSPAQRLLRVEDFEDAVVAQAADPRIQMVLGLSVLELCLVIALHKLHAATKARGAC
jgi:origin recognition complex subunit 4